MNTKELLIEARTLIEKPKGWTKGNYARNSENNGVAPSSPDAVCFCAVGALLRADTSKAGGFSAARAALKRQCPLGLDVQEFNDEREHADVLDLFDRAIAAAQ